MRYIFLMFIYKYINIIFFSASSKQPIQDPDPLMNCDLMDGRDAFLTLARDKHYEFSSLRRAQFSTLCMLYELHNQGNDKFVYTCNNCKNHVETRFHCTICDVRIVSFFFSILEFNQIAYSSIRLSFNMKNMFGYVLTCHFEH